MRKVLAQTYERGRETGRAEVSAEMELFDTRAAMLDAGADFLDLLAGRSSMLPNANRALTAFRESAAILRDARALGEPPQVRAAIEPLPPPKAKTPKKVKG